MNIGKQKKNIFENRNGRQYVIVQEKGDVAMLMPFDGSSVIIACGINKESHEWEQGYYYTEMCVEAVKAYQESEGHLEK